MEKGFVFTPPPFLGSGFRQNHQIRALKSNSYPYLTSHRSFFPSSSHTAPSLGLLTSRNTANSSAFARTNLTSHRRKHLRRCYDLVHLCVQRRQIALAARFLRVILAAHEWTTDEGWRMALLLLALSPAREAEEREEDEEVEDSAATRRKIGYLQMLDLDSSAYFKATHITPALISEYIAANRLSDAIELLEQRVNVHPYKSQPELHTTLGMLYLFVSIQTLLNSRNNDSSHSGGRENEPETAQEQGQGGVSLRLLDRTTRNKARQCFETALQASEAWVRTETQRRQRIYAMHCQDVAASTSKIARRHEMWGLDPLGDDADDAWPVEEHADVRKVRRRLEGESPSDDEEAADSADVADAEDESDATSASGSVYAGSSAGNSESEEERGRTRTRTRTRTPQPAPDVEPASPPEEDYETPAGAPQRKGPKSWARVWPEIAPVWTPTPPLAASMAREFLALLAPPVRRTRRVRGTAHAEGFDLEDAADMDTDGEGEGEGGVLGGVQLTREEAEQRLRRILFEGEEDLPDPAAEGRVKKEKGRERESREERRKRKRDRREREREHGSTRKQKRRRDEYYF